MEKIKKKMSNIKHIHEVVFLVEQHNGQWSAEELVENIAQTWGSEVHFGSCSGTAFPKEQALDFLLNRQKVLIEHGKITLHPSMQLCKGHEGF